MTARLDASLAARGLARSRTHAASLIADGLVTVNGAPIAKAAHRVGEEDIVAVAAVADHYVSRGAHKLVRALDGFEVPVAGRLALDMGASTGGFTQVLRERGARRVLAVDVGHDQLAPPLREDSAVTMVEGFNVRYMTPVSLAAATGEQDAPEVVVGDLSFISLALVLPAIAAVASPTADVLLLVKPQFEVGRAAVHGGLVTDPVARSDVLERTLWSAWDAGLGTSGILPSPILGTHGNAEYLVYLVPGGGTDPSEWRGKIERIAGGR